MPELTPRQIAILERLFAKGFRGLTTTLYANAIGVRKGDCAALLWGAPDGNLHVVGSPAWLIENNLSVRLTRAGREWFVWKKKKLAVTSQRLKQLEAFQRELQDVLCDTI